MAPVSEKPSHLILCSVRIAGIRVDALVDTGATASCCKWDWYKRWESQLGPLKETCRMVVGVENSPVPLNGVLGPVSFEWDRASGQFELLVLPALDDVDVIIGMDILSQLEVRIDTKVGIATPRREISTPIALVLDRTVRLPAGKSKIFFLNTPGIEELTLFEPSLKLPKGVQSVPSLSEGPRIAIQLDNRSEEEIMLNPEWTIGQLSQVHLVDKSPSEESSNLPEVPKDLNARQRRQLRLLLDRYSDVFSKKGNPITSTPYIAHEIHTTGPPIRQPSRRQNPLIREQEQQQVQEMLRDGVIRPSVSPWASPVVMVKKKG